MNHIRLVKNLGLSFPGKSGVSGAGMEKGWDQRQRDHFTEGKSPSSSRHSPQNTLIFKVPTFLPALLGGCGGEEPLPQEQGGAGNLLASDPKVWGQCTAPECALPPSEEG